MTFLHLIHLLSRRILNNSNNTSIFNNVVGMQSCKPHIPAVIYWRNRANLSNNVSAHRIIVGWLKNMNGILDKIGKLEDRQRSGPERVKMYVWKRDDGRCAYCKSNKKLEYDHIIPVSKGGSNTARNIQLLCERCNRSKSAKIGLEEYF